MTEHAALGASNASRWMACPGSVALEDGLPETSTEFSREGTAAHALAKLGWDLARDPQEWLGEELEGVVVDHEMVEGVRFFLTYIQGLAQGAAEMVTERKFTLERLRPPRPMFGTTDFAAVHLEAKRLEIADLKYGKGVKVSAVGNPQGRYYALGFWLDLFRRNRRIANSLREIRIHIIQPRILDEEGESSVSTETLTLQELKGWAQQLLEAARRTTMQNPGLAAGDHCRFCKAQAICPELRQRSLALAQLEFSDLEQRAAQPPLPEQMTPAQLAAVLEHKDLLLNWLKGCEAFALAEMERGRSPAPGWARAPKRATRKWRDEKTVVTTLGEQFGADEDDLYERTLKSPAQVEKLVGKGKLPEDLVVAESSGWNLVRDTDKRAVRPAASEFDTL